MNKFKVLLWYKLIKQIHIERNGLIKLSNYYTNENHIKWLKCSNFQDIKSLFYTPGYTACKNVVNRYICDSKIETKVFAKI